MIRGFLALFPISVEEVDVAAEATVHFSQPYKKVNLKQDRCMYLNQSLIEIFDPGAKK